MEGAMRSLSNTSLFVKGGRGMWYAILIVLCLFLGFLLDRAIREIHRLREDAKRVIHFGLKKDGPTTLFIIIRPKDFQIKADEFREKLLRGLATEKQSDALAWAYSILNHIDFWCLPMESRSRSEIRDALAHLLEENDGEAAKRFIKSLADALASVL
ncbi:MAG: hypothetical protein ABSB00_01350 [Minisyncoccia bacterium]|jgi:hypothetical protein